MIGVWFFMRLISSLPSVLWLEGRKPWSIYTSRFSMGLTPRSKHDPYSWLCTYQHGMRAAKPRHQINTNSSRFSHNTNLGDFWKNQYCFIQINCGYSEKLGLSKRFNWSAACYPICMKQLNQKNLDLWPSCNRKCPENSYISKGEAWERN